MADFITLTAEDRVTETTKVTTGYFTGDVGTLAGSNFTTSSLATGEKIYYYNLQYSSEDQLSVAYGHIGGSGSLSGSTANKVGQTEAIYRQFASQLLKPDETIFRDKGITIELSRMGIKGPNPLFYELFID